MELRTTFAIEKSRYKITYNDPVIFTGSCFATEIGKQLEAGKMQVMINPSATLYNPVSVFNTLEAAISGRQYTIGDIYNNKGTWFSFDHYTDFSSEDPEDLLNKINKAGVDSHNFISGARFLFITFGTARVYRWKKSGSIVSNCHRIPAAEFTNELLSISDIVSLWNSELTKLKSHFPDLKVVFTISPVRHWKDGAHGNQISKSVLLLSVEELLKHPSGPEYFPAYELLMDDLRDYRFYNDDMLHPSSSAINYIWQKFEDCYFDHRTIEIRHEIIKITKACRHRLTGAADRKKKEFAALMLDKIQSVERKIPSVDFSFEKSYFKEILDG